MRKLLLGAHLKILLKLCAFVAKVGTAGKYHTLINKQMEQHQEKCSAYEISLEIVTPTIAKEVVKAISILLIVISMLGQLIFRERQCRILSFGSMEIH